MSQGFAFDLPQEPLRSLLRLKKAIQGFAAIAEENTASSQRISSTVADFSVRIKDLVDNIEQLEKWATEFRGELTRYAI